MIEKARRNVALAHQPFGHEESEEHIKEIEEELKVSDKIDISSLVQELQDVGNNCGSPVKPIYSSFGGHLLPSREDIFEVMDLLLSVIFPGYFGKSEVSFQSIPFHMGTTIDRVSRILKEQVRRGFCFTCPVADMSMAKCRHKAERITHTFLRKLPHIRRMLCTDVYAGYIGDPAATSTHEVIFCYPGLLAIAYQRIAHELYLLDVPIIPRIITERAHTLTGIDIHPGASIDEGLFIDHGTGVVIGETATIGKGVRIYQGVTLGAKSFPLDEEGNPIKGIKRHPNLEDKVIVYSGATVLGNVTIGEGSIIGGNVWLTHDIPPYTRLVQRTHKEDHFEASEILKANKNI